ncbi:MAG: ABC transporter substrate-binding protein [Candidatus Zixiibacteriota bacterium]
MIGRWTVQDRQIKGFMTITGYRWTGWTILHGIVALVVMASGIGQAEPASTRVHIGIVKTLDLPQYNNAYQGFINTLRSTGYEPTSTEVILSGDEAAINNSIAKLRESKPDVILALGTKAANEVSRREKSIPIIYSMVLDQPGAVSGAGGRQTNVTGSSLNIPLDVQFKYIQAVFPTASRVGIISNPERSGHVVDSAQRAASGRGLNLTIRSVSSEAGIPDAVRSLVDSIDVFFMIADATVFTPQSSRYVIFEFIKAGIPIMGLSSAYVKAGAVMALDCDYTDIGRQSGELAVRILAGQSPQTVSETTPRVYTLAVNENVLEHLKIEMADGVLNRPDIKKF